MQYWFFLYLTKKEKEEENNKHLVVPVVPVVPVMCWLPTAQIQYSFHQRQTRKKKKFIKLKNNAWTIFEQVEESSQIIMNKTNSTFQWGLFSDFPICPMRLARLFFSIPLLEPIFWLFSLYFLLSLYSYIAYNIAIYIHMCVCMCVFVRMFVYVFWFIDPTLCYCH